MYVRNVKRCKTHKTDFPKGWTNDTMEKNICARNSISNASSQTSSNERYNRDFTQPMAMQNLFMHSIPFLKPLKRHKTTQIVRRATKIFRYMYFHEIELSKCQYSELLHSFLGEDYAVNLHNCGLTLSPVCIALNAPLCLHLSNLNSLHISIWRS